MKAQQLFLTIFVVLCCQQVTAGKFTTLLEGNPGAQAKISHTMAKINTINSGKQDQVGCNQDIGNVEQGNYARIKDNIVVVKGDVINVCK